jgi:uncharacterized protein with FMN-binding domain
MKQGELSGMTQGGSGNKSSKVANKLVGASFVAVLAVYTAGYDRTQSAANRLAAQVAERRAAVPAPGRVTLHVPQLGSPAPIPARLLPPPAPLPEPTRKAVTASHVETAPAQSDTKPDTKIDVPAAAAEPVRSEASEAPLTAVQAIAPAMNAAPVPAVVPAPAPSKPAWKDGTYTGWGYSRHGNIEAAVVIEGGRIASAAISQCRTRYSCDVIDKLIPQVAQRQSPDVDYVSGATQSADAFYGAVVEALSKAK